MSILIDHKQPNRMLNVQAEIFLNGFCFDPSAKLRVSFFSLLTLPWNRKQSSQLQQTSYIVLYSGP